MVRLRQNSQRSQTRSIRISSRQQQKSRYEQLQNRERIWKKSWVRGQRKKSCLRSSLRLRNKRKLEIHYKTVTEARSIRKRMTELDSVIASLTEQLKESISISAEELNAQKALHSKRNHFQKIVMKSMPAWKSTVTCMKKSADSRQSF